MRHAIRRLAAPRRQRGQVLILVGLSLIVLVGAVGLAIDSGRAYGVKARLNAAVDAAAIAAARAVATGVDDATRIAQAQAAAVRFFNLNYPAGFFGSTPAGPTTSAVHDSSGYWRINVSASAQMPTTFMRVLGQLQTDVSAAGEAIRRDLDVMLVMDTSGSLAPPISSSSTFPTLKNAAINDFVNKFSAGAGGDRVGLVSFASGAVIDVPINKTSARGFTRATVNSAINALSAQGATASAEGMRKGFSELEAVPAALRSSLRVILLFSDGAPNIVNGSFPRSSGTPNPIVGNLYSETTGQGNDPSYPNSPYKMFREDRRNISYGSNSDNDGYTVNNITGLPTTGSGSVPLASYAGHPWPRTLSGTPYTDTRCNVNRAARNMVENIANTARGQEVRIYAIGLGDALDDLEPSFSGGNCGYTSARERGSVILKRLANTADSDTRNTAQPQGLYCWAQDASALGRCFSSIASEILRLTL